VPETRDPGEAIARLAIRLGEEAAKAGWNMIPESFVFHPNLQEGGRHVGSAFFVLSDEPPTAAELDAEVFDAEFEQMMRDEKKAEEAAAVEATRAKLQASLEKGGILDDDDEPE
jgi:hypothetical protein